MTASRRHVTTVIQANTSTSGSTPMVRARELVAMREEVFSSQDLDTGAGTQRALQAVQRHVAEATQAARSLPVQGGTYWPSVKFTANSAHLVQHGVAGGLEVSWMALSVRPATVNVAAVSQGRIVEVSQDAPRGRITLASSEACTADLWFWARPSAEGS